MRRLIILSLMVVFAAFLSSGVQAKAKTSKNINTLVRENIWSAQIISSLDGWELSAAGMKIRREKIGPEFKGLADRLFSHAFEKNSKVAWLIGHFFESHISNITKAISWYQRSAALGDAQAHRSLGHLYYFGEQVKTDYALARFHLAKAKDGFSAETLGSMHLDGLGGDKNPSKALSWFMKSVSQGRVETLNLIGHSYWIEEFKAKIIA